MSDVLKLRCLEGLGYIAAFMIGIGGVGGLDESAQPVDYFNVLGLVFAIIVIVRLMVMNISLAHVERLYDAPRSDVSDVEEV